MDTNPQGKQGPGNTNPRRKQGPGDAARKLWLRVGLAALSLLLIAGIFWLMRGGGPDEALEVKAPQDADNTTEPDEEGYIMVGGVRRLASDVAPIAPREMDEEALAELHKKLDYGELPRIDADANPQVESVAEALRDETHPERVSVLVRPKKFDPKAFKADPAAYLEIVEPARVFQAAQPAPGVPRLRPADARRHNVVRGDTATLRVVTAPGAPVTFTSFDAGAFENQLTSITVQADAQGMAEAKFLATAGTIANIHILAASPLASGQARFIVNVAPPEES